MEYLCAVLNVYPNLVVAGAPKCGTSSLFFWLAAHPEAAPSREKETFFWAPEVNRFNAKCNVQEHGSQAYSRLFAHTAGYKLRFEATAPYLYYREAREGLAALDPKPLVLFILREPAARTQSQFLFETHRTGRVKGTFQEYIQEPHILDHGHYVRYLEQWKSALGAENMVVWQFEWVMNNPRQAMQELAKRMGIDPAFYDHFDFAVRNETLSIRSKKLHKLGLKIQSLVPLAVQDALLPLYLKINGAGRPKADASLKAETAALKPQFAESNKALAALFQAEIDLDLWR